MCNPAKHTAGLGFFLRKKGGPSDFILDDKGGFDCHVISDVFCFFCH